MRGRAVRGRVRRTSGGGRSAQCSAPPLRTRRGPRGGGWVCVCVVSRSSVRPSGATPRRFAEDVAHLRAPPAPPRPARRPRVRGGGGGDEGGQAQDRRQVPPREVRPQDRGTPRRTRPHSPRMLTPPRAARRHHPRALHRTSTPSVMNGFLRAISAAHAPARALWRPRARSSTRRSTATIRSSSPWARVRSSRAGTRCATRSNVTSASLLHPRTLSYPWHACLTPSAR